jgi:hypothetical protein
MYFICEVSVKFWLSQLCEPTLVSTAAHNKVLTSSTLCSDGTVLVVLSTTTRVADQVFYILLATNLIHIGDNERVKYNYMIATSLALLSSHIEETTTTFSHQSFIF